MSAAGPSAPAAPGVLESAARWAAVAATAAPWLAVACAARARSLESSHRLLTGWTRLAARLLGIRVAIEDRNRDYSRPPYLFVGLNQTSLAETLVFHQGLPAPFEIVCNLEYALLPLVGWATVAAGGVTVVRQWPAQARRALGVASARIRSGRNFAISIEGQRSKDGALSPYKKGPAVLAIETGATIVPFLLRGARERLPYGEWRVRPGAVSVVLCDAIPTAGLTYADRDALTARLRALAEKELACS